MVIISANEETRVKIVDFMKKLKLNYILKIRKLKLLEELDKNNYEKIKVNLYIYNLNILIF